MIQVYHIIFRLSIALGRQETKERFCIMNKKQETNLFVKECITEALFALMRTKSLSEISVTEIVERAGVARVSFYRNFGSKEDVIKKHLGVLICEWGRDFEKRGELAYFSESLLKHFYKHREFYLLLYKHGLSAMIYENLRDACDMKSAQTNLERYTKSMFAGAIFGWLDEWARQGMPETPEEIALLANKQI